MPAPFYTIAARVLHYGRYGSGAEDPRLTPLYIGYPGTRAGVRLQLVRPRRLHAERARVRAREFDRLLGSRMLVGNLEFRFPLLRPFKGANQRMYGPLPVEVGVVRRCGRRVESAASSRRGSAGSTRACAARGLSRA